MGVYAYCLGDSAHPSPASVHGLEGAVVRSVAAAGFSVWVTDLDHAPAASLGAVRAHNRVVEAAAVEATPLPFRFGQWFGSLEKLETSLLERRTHLDRRLRHVRGALEHGVRVLDPAHTPRPRDRSSGTAYLEALALQARDDQVVRARGREVAAALHRWLEPLVRDERVRLVGGGTVAAIAHLVDRHDTGSYRRRVEGFPARWPELRFLFTGPWPPYGFAE